MGMKATQLNEAMAYLDDQYLDMAEAPKKETLKMTSNRNRRILHRLVLAAAMVMMLAITAYATDFMNIKTLCSGASKRYSSYEKMETAIKEVGFRVNVPESFQNGYTFESVSVDDTHALDENDKTVFTYRELWVNYRRSGSSLALIAQKDMTEIPHTNSPVAQSRKIGDTLVNYTVDHYKFVPADYSPTQEELAWMEIPGNYMSYGSEKREESDVAFLTWTVDGIAYTIMDTGAREEPNVLFAMAEELLKR